MREGELSERSHAQESHCDSTVACWFTVMKAEWWLPEEGRIGGSFANDGNILFLVCYGWFHRYIQRTHCKLHILGCSLLYRNYSSVKLVRAKKKRVRCSHVEMMMQRKQDRGGAADRWSQTGPREGGRSPADQRLPDRRGSFLCLG